jgi:hypothetical protein
MHRFLLAPLAAALLLGPAARAQDDPRALIRAAIDARGGEAKVAQSRAAVWKIKGTFHSVHGTFTGEISTQLPAQYKVLLHFDQNGVRTTQVQVLSGGRGWIGIDGRTQEMDEETLAQMKESAYVDHVGGLLPLLKDKGFTLSSAGAAEVLGRPAVAVRVTSAGQPTLQLFFDKATGLMVQLERKVKDRASGKETLRRAVVGDYGEIDPAAAEEQALRAAKVAPDGPALLEFVRKHTLADADRNALRELIRRLGDDAFAVREKASAELAAQGPAAAPLLRQAVNDPDPEISRRASQCLKKMEGAVGPQVIAAVVRLLALRRPPGAAEALLAYLPSAPDEGVAREVRAALAAVAFQDRQPDKALVQALEDPDPVRRQAAAAALGRDGGVYQRQPGRRVYPDGLKTFRKVTRYEDGKKTIEWEILEVQFFNKLDDGVFAKP